MYSFFNLANLFNYFGDNTLPVVDKNVKYVTDILKSEPEIAIRWFANSVMETNPDKLQCMILCDSSVKSIEVGNT